MQSSQQYCDGQGGSPGPFPSGPDGLGGRATRSEQEAARQEC